VVNQVLMDGQTDGERKQARSQAAVKWDAGVTGMVVFWTGAVLTLAALFDSALALYPTMFGSPEWEFGSISGIVAGLPLLTIGLVGMWIGGGLLGRRWMSLGMGVAFLVGAVCVIGALVLFTLDVPVALRATQDVAQGNIKQLVAKTLALGCMFGTGYVVAGVIALRQARRANP